MISSFGNQIELSENDNDKLNEIKNKILEISKSIQDLIDEIEVKEDSLKNMLTDYEKKQIDRRIHNNKMMILVQVFC